MPNNMIDPRGSGPAPKPAAKPAPKPASKPVAKAKPKPKPQPKAKAKSKASGTGGGGSSAKKPKASSTPGQPSLDYSQLAQQYGWSMAMINSDPSLKKLFGDAVKGSWTADKFVAELRNTNWFKKNSETARQAAVLKTTDPATYKQRLASLSVSIASMARDMGAPISRANMSKITEQAFTLGWNDDQIRNTLSGYISFTKGGTLSGLAAQVEDNLRQYARAMGVKIGDDYIVKAARKVASKESSVEQQRDILAQTAISAYPHFKERIQAGETVADIAAPYKAAFAQILEVPEDSVELDEMQIKKALSYKDEGGKISARPLWEFENQLRNDPRWLKTQNAQDSVMQVARQVLTDFGIQH